MSSPYNLPEYDDRPPSPDNQREIQGESGIQPLPAEFLQAIGAREPEERVFGPPLHDSLKLGWKILLEEGLTDAERLALIKEYPPPENGQFLDTPKMNPEVECALAESCKLRDKRLQKRQSGLFASMTGIGAVLSKLLQAQEPDLLPIIKLVGDAGRLVLDSAREETYIRRNLALSNLNSTLRSVLQTTTPGEFLFGDQLPDAIRAKKQLEQSAAELKLEKTQAARQPPKNVSAPPRRPVQTAPPVMGGQFHQPRRDYHRQPYRYRQASRPRPRSRSSRRDYPRQQHRNSYRRR